MRGDILALPALEADHLNDELSVVNPAGIESVGEHIDCAAPPCGYPKTKTVATGIGAPQPSMFPLQSSDLEWERGSITDEVS
jgi:hypothetical protein